MYAVALFNKTTQRSHVVSCEFSTRKECYGWIDTWLEIEERAAKLEGRAMYEDTFRIINLEEGI